MTEEAKPVIRKVVVKKVIKKVEGASASSQQVANDSEVKKPIAKAVIKPIAKSTSQTDDSSVPKLITASAKSLVKTSVEAKVQGVTKPIEKQSTKLIAKPNEVLKMNTTAQPIDQENIKSKRKSVASQPKKSSKLPLLPIIFVALAFIVGGGWYFTKGSGPKADNGNGGASSSGSSIPFMFNVLPTASASLTLPMVARLPAGAPLWVHLVNSAGDAEALKNGPLKALDAYKELKAASPFVLLSPVPPKEGWLKPGKMKELAAEVQKTIKDQKCDATRLVISGEGVGTTAALLLAGELNGAVGAVLGIGAPSEEAFVEVERFRYVPLRFLAKASDKDAVGWTQKIAGDLRGMGCAVSVTEISPSPNLIGGAWGAPEIWAWMATRRVADANTRAGIDSLLAWSAPKRPAGLSLTAKPAVVDEAQIVKGSLLGEYFDGVAFNAKILERLDKSINIPDRAYQLPDNKADNLSVRWTGLIKIDKEGVYTFYNSSDDGQRVFVGGVAVVDDWADHGATEKSGTIKLTVGWYNLVVEHYQGGGGGSVSSWWSGPGFEKKLIEGDMIATLKAKPGK